MGDPCDVVVVRERLTGRLAGIGCRAERRAFVNGREERIGYIGQIRAADGYRGRWLVQRAMAWLRASGHADLLYCGVVARENPRARELLVGRRAPGAPVRSATRRADHLRDPSPSPPPAADRPASRSSRARPGASPRSSHSCGRWDRDASSSPPTRSRTSPAAGPSGAWPRRTWPWPGGAGGSWGSWPPGTSPPTSRTSWPRTARAAPAPSRVRRARPGARRAAAHATRRDDPPLLRGLHGRRRR